MPIFTWQYFLKEAIPKYPLKPRTYFPYLDDIFIIWPHGKDAFSEFINIFNTHEPPIKFKSSICIDSVNYLDTTVVKDPKNNNTLSTKVFFKATDIHQMLHKHSFSSQTYL